MTDRTVEFEHDGHRFTAGQQESAPVVRGGEPMLRWEVTMDGAPALEFFGEYPYRDEDVEKRVLEWYRIQKPIARRAD